MYYRITSCPPANEFAAVMANALKARFEERWQALNSFNAVAGIGS